MFSLPARGAPRRISLKERAVLQWLEEHQEWLWSLGAASLVIFIASLFIIPALVVRIRPDYFAHERRPASFWARQPVAIRTTILIAKNLLGMVLLLAGILMLVLPGQGLLTLLVGFLLID